MSSTVAAARTRISPSSKHVWLCSILLLVLWRSADGAEERRVSTPLNPDQLEALGIRLVNLPPGAFLMGCVPGDAACKPEEKPQHEVTFAKPLRVTESEISNSQYHACVTVGACKPPAASVAFPDLAKPDHPVVLVSWFEANDFCKWMGGRLLTEAEWEYAARAGNKGLRFVWGDEAAPIVGGQKFANVADLTLHKAHKDWPFLATYDDGWPETSPLKAFQPNAFGLYDMAGNVWEWTMDAWHPGYEGAPADGSIWDSPTETRRVLRGGSWYSDLRTLRVSHRGATAPETRGDNAGFRCSVPAP